MSAPPPRTDGVRLTVTAPLDQGVAVTTNERATAAAMTILRQSGNAVDAAVAANAVLAVVRPDTCGLGGDLFALVHRPGMSAPAALNASGRAGSGTSAAQLRAAGHDVVPLRGAPSITIPGCVDGWEALLTRFGTMQLADALEPAIVAARGFTVAPELADSLGAATELLRGQPSADALYPAGIAPRAGETVVRPDLASTLTTLASGGRRAFYGGVAGRAISEVTGGVVTADDLATIQADWVEPLGLDVYGVRAWTVPPNSQGHLTLTASWLAERLRDGEPGSAAYHHDLIEAYRAVAWERDLLTSDPATVALSPTELVDPARLEARLTRIRPDAVATWPSSRPVPGGTMFLCVRDGSGMGISLIQSNFHGIGSGVGAGATGVFLHNRGAGFTLEPGHRNELAPGRRPLHTLSPALLTAGGSLRMLLGTRGGQYQPQLLLQVAAHRLGAGLPLEHAMAAPRWIVDQWGPDETHTVTVEERIGEDVIAGLRERGHQVDVAASWQRGWGPVAAIEVGDSAVEGAGDPRVSGSGTDAT